MGKMPNENLHGSALTQGSVIVLSFTGIAMAVCIGLGIYFRVHSHIKSPALFILGPVIFLIGLLLCAPNLKNVIRGKIKEHRIRTGKEQPVQKKSYHPEHRFDD